jgi:hypothetical protein
MAAVLLGDVVGWSQLPAGSRHMITDTLLKDAFSQVRRHIDPHSPAGEETFEIFRGDSFQGIIFRAKNALKAALYLRAALLSARINGTRTDCRLAIGVGSLEYRPARRVGEMDGEAFRAASRGLELLVKRNQRMSLQIAPGVSSSTPGNTNERELMTELLLTDAIIQNWNPTQAEAMKCWLLSKPSGLPGAGSPGTGRTRGGGRGRLREKARGAWDTQQDIAAALQISQGAVSQRLKRAKYWAIESVLQRYEEIIQGCTIPGEENDPP